MPQNRKPVPNYLSNLDTDMIATEMDMGPTHLTAKQIKHQYLVILTWHNTQ